MYICNICQKSFEKKMALAGHKRIHNGKPYIRKKQLRLGDINLRNHIGCHICKFCGKEYSTGMKLGGHVPMCKLNPSRSINLTKKPKTLPKWSLESRKKLSISMKRYLTNHQDKVPYLLNHSSKVSYPELYFKELFEKENIPLNFMVRVLSYRLDFCDSDKKLDIEIDGEQHYVDKTIIEHDKKRNFNLGQIGWTIYRIRWSEYKKKTFEDKQKVIQEIKDLMRL